MLIDLLKPRGNTPLRHCSTPREVHSLKASSSAGGNFQADSWCARPGMAVIVNHNEAAPACGGCNGSCTAQRSLGSLPGCPCGTSRPAPPPPGSRTSAALAAGFCARSRAPCPGPAAALENPRPTPDPEGCKGEEWACHILRSLVVICWMHRKNGFSPMPAQTHPKLAPDPADHSRIMSTMHDCFHFWQGQRSMHSAALEIPAGRRADPVLQCLTLRHTTQITCQMASRA